MLKRLFATYLLGLAFALPATAASVLPLFLDEIVDQSTVAFQGICTGNRSERDAQTGLIVTLTTFQVQDGLKGDAGQTYTIKQIGGELPAEGVRFKLEGVPSFQVGQSYVVFMAGVSSAGFSSPIGLGQGRFSIVPGASGLQVTNGRDFKDLASRIVAQALSKSAQAKLGDSAPVTTLGLEDFKTLVRQHMGSAK
jgi:hypothetical protein